MSSGGREQRKNIFLTTLGVSKDRLDIDYFVCDNAAGTLSYTTGISVAEAGIKYMLSQHRIDEIIVLGSPRGAEESESGKVSIESADIRNISSLDAMSEFGFLRYRIAEFLHRTDFEILDISELLSDSERSALKEKIRAFRSSHRVVMGLKDLFSQLCSDAALAEAFEAEVLSGCTKEEKKWVKHYLFSQMDSFLKMHMRDENREVSIRYLPTVSDGMISIESITKVVTETLSESGGEINLYMDIQGIGATDGNTLISTFLLLSRRIGFGCRVRGLISSSRMSDAFSGTVRNALQSYEIQQLITGIDLFLEYGKDKKLREYWKTMQIEDPDADRLFVGMDCVDEGITLCNVDLIACGINVIRHVVQNPKVRPEDRNIYVKILVGAIISDYGPLLEGEELSIPELLKWSHRKALYQQTLTIIESKVPEDLVRRGIYYYAENESHIKALMEEFNLLYWSDQAKMRWSYNDIEHYFIKYYGRGKIDFRQKPDFVAKDYARLRVAAVRGETEDILPAFSQLNRDSLLYELLLSYYRIGNLRNQVNHAAVDEIDVDGDSILKRKDNRDLLDDALERFISLYSSACRLTKKTREPMLLPSGKMKAYTRHHQLQPLEEETDLTVKNTYVCQFNGKEVLINISLLKPEPDNDEE